MIVRRSSSALTQCRNQPLRINPELKGRGALGTCSGRSSRPGGILTPGVALRYSGRRPGLRIPKPAVRIRKSANPLSGPRPRGSERRRCSTAALAVRVLWPTRPQFFSPSHPSAQGQVRIPCPILVHKFFILARAMISRFQNNSNSALRVEQKERIR